MINGGSEGGNNWIFELISVAQTLHRFFLPAAIVFIDVVCKVIGSLTHITNVSDITVSQIL